MQEGLGRLRTEGQRLVDGPFLRGERTHDPAAVAEVVEPYPDPTDADVEAVERLLQRTVAQHDPYDTAMDAAVAPGLHEALDVSRRVAADPGIWHYLTVVVAPEFVRHRWQYTSEAAMREKFLGAGTDIYSNALHRLWWIAELTEDGGSYDVTVAALENQTIANKVFDRWFARYKPAAKVCCAKLASYPSSIAEQVTADLNQRLSTLQLEAMDEGDIKQVVDDLVTDALD